MDGIQEHLTSLYSFYNTHSSTVSTVMKYINRANAFVQSTLVPFFLRITDKPDLASLALLLILLFISLKVLNLLYQAVMWWVRLFFRLVFWGAIIAVVTWVVARGPDGVVDDIGGLVDTFKGEYSYWQARDQEARYFKDAQPGYAGGSGHGGGYRAYGRGRGF
ncbi:Sexual differentiation process protein isp4 [Sphaceloma murrayae]|uniref:Sexual differentiation process protein isp4 n=1 Tax=Sphaceloma murrayae TaxID=2082308 RepID=A0A2K1QXR5_9PEZI|nr:Sexual differentiation process protein isp4 [Sphaceloma murrayae]